MVAEYQTDKPASFGKRKLKDFAPVFAADGVIERVTSSHPLN